MQLHPDEVVFRPIDELQATRQIDMLHRSSNYASAAVAALSEIIVAAVRDVLSDAVQIL